MFEFIQELSPVDIVSIIVSLIALMFSVFTYIRTDIYEKREATMRAYLDLQESLQFLYRYQKDEIETFVSDNQTPEYKSISSCVARLELFAVGMKRKIYDFETFYLMAHGFVDMTLKVRISHIIEMKTEKSCDEFYQNSIWMFEKMEKRQNKKLENEDEKRRYEK
jgi:hypothetical protein